MPDRPAENQGASVELEADITAELSRRLVPEGGFGRHPGKPFDVPSTVWAVLALASGEAPPQGPLAKSAERLVQLQRPDGRLPVDSRFPETHWPTSLLIMIASALPGYQQAGRKAAQCILKLAGAHWEKQPDDPNGHDTSIPGWGWASYSHAWVEPTALAILALRLQGMGNHERVKQGIALLLDRQLVTGGWNYGNTTVFGRQLFPTPDSTGHALCALQGLVPEERVSASLAYVWSEVRKIRTPLSLAWDLMALSAWRRRPTESREWIGESLALQSRYGPYETSLLAQLMLAQSASGGLLGLLGRELSS